MSRASFAESQAVDAGMSRAASRAGSISTLWSSAEVPLCLDPRVQPSRESFDTSRQSVVGSIARSSQYSIDFGRLSIDIPDEYPRRPDSIRLTPPRASASSSGSSPSRVPSFNIGTIDEDTALPSVPSSSVYRAPSAGAQPRVLSSRFSEDTIDETLPASTSYGTFGARLSVPSKSSSSSSAAAAEEASDESRSSSLNEKDCIVPTRSAAQQAPSELYRRAYRFFDKEYTVQPSGEAQHFESDAAHAQFERPSVGSELSHEESVASCASTRATSSSDSASAYSADSLSRAPAIVNTDHLHTVDAYLTSKPHRSASDQSDALSIPSLPSLPSFNSGLTATRADLLAREIRRRPSTADVYTNAAPVSPHTFSNVPLPLPPVSLPMVSPTQPQIPPEVRYEVQSYSMAPASKAGARSRLLRTRVASTPKLRLDADSLFPSEQALHVQHPVPPLPGRLSNPATDRRPSTSQMDGRAPFFGRRFRSRTLGESDRTVAVTTTRPAPMPPAPAVAPRLSANGAVSMLAQRHPSHVSAASSELQPTPGSSICSASSPATTNSSLPVTPRTTLTFPRPKSRGSAAKVGGAGWASYLNSGLTLHLEGDQGRVCCINMTYLAYDPFGRPEQLVEGTEAARALTPKRPKSRGDKDVEAEQSGTLEFGPFVDEQQAGCTFGLSRKADATALLKHLTVGEETKADLLTRQAALSLKTIGEHQVGGYERKGRLAWKFTYRVEPLEANVGRRLVPVRFSCSATLLNPERARKSRLLNLVKKQMVPTLASKAVDSPRSATYSYDGTASPASSKRSNQLAPAEAQPVSPIRRSAANGGLSAYSSPLRQTGRPSANSVASADSSFCSQPVTPGREASHADTTVGRLHLQASPVSEHFGQRQLHSLGAASATTTITAGGAAVAPALQLDLGPSRQLQAKASMVSLSASSQSSASGQLSATAPIVINGRKLIPISLPAGLARKSRIDPALLQANVVRNPSADVRQRSTSTHSSASDQSQNQNQNQRQRQQQQRGLEAKCILSNQPRSGAAVGSSRPPTASEAIKLEYLSRTVCEEQQTLRHQKSFAGAVLTPSSFAQGRQRSKTIEDARPRPFTADAWGEAQFPSREQVLSATTRQQQHHGEEALKPLPAPPRPSTRPRTTQTNTAPQTRYHLPVRAS